MSKPSINNQIGQAIAKQTLELIDKDQSHRVGLHVSDYSNPCQRQAYLSHTDVEQVRRDSPGAAWFGSNHHDKLDQLGHKFGTGGEIPLIWDISKDTPVKAKNGLMPEHDEYTIRQWLDFVVGELDTIRYVKVDGWKGNILLDYKFMTGPGKGWTKPAVSPDHVDQINYYNYIMSRMTGMQPMTKGMVLQFDHAYGFTWTGNYVFDLRPVGDVLKDMLVKRDAYLEAYKTGKLPPRVTPELDAGGHIRRSYGNKFFDKDYGHPLRINWKCDWCAYEHLCMTDNPKTGMRDPSDWETLSKSQRQINILQGAKGKHGKKE